jgi:hypothetical protein
MYERKQAEYEQAIDDLTQTCLINESNLALAFNHYSDDELAKLISEGKKHICLHEGKGYRTVEIEQIKCAIAEDDEFTFKLIELSLDEPLKTKKLVNKRIEAIIKADIAQIKLDWIDLLTGA